jgi:peptidyl-prolyl cis-trans isomerase D
MVASDADISQLLRRSRNPQTAVLATINGENILYKDFSEKVQEQIEQQRAQSQNKDLQVDEVQVRQRVWDELVRNIILKQEAKKAGIFVSADEIRDVMIDNPPDYLRKPFTDSTGRFQRENYLEILTNPDVIMSRLPQSMSQTEKKSIVDNWKKDILNIENELRKQKLSEAMTSLVNASYDVNSPLYVKQKFIDEKSKADVNYVLFDIRTIPDSTITISDQEIQKMYDQIKGYFEQKAKRKIKYVSFKLVPSSQDSAAADKKIKKISEELSKGTENKSRDSIFVAMMHNYEGEVHEYKPIPEIDPNVNSYLTSMKQNDVLGPVQTREGTSFLMLDSLRKGENEQVRASHILIQFGTNKDSARAEAMKILEMAKSGQQFAMLAAQFSKDQGTAMKGGDCGYFSKGKMVKPFEDAAFAAPVDAIVGPIETQFGYHIIKVVDKNSEEYKYSEIKITPFMSKMTEKSINRDALELIRIVKAGTVIDSAAKQLNQVARETPFFEEGKPAISSNYLSAKAFETEVGKVIEEPINIKNVGITVAQVTDSRKAGLMTIEDLKSIITRRIYKVKKLDMVKAQAVDFAQKVSSLDSLNKANSINPGIVVKSAPGVANNGNVKELGYDFVFTNEAMILPVGKISPAIRGEMGYFVMQVTNREMPEVQENSQEYTEYVQSLNKKNADATFRYWMNKVMNDAKIEDHRNDFWKEY